MATPLRVLFVSSEVEPFAKTGGLADVSGALPLALKQLGHEVRVIMPRYASIRNAGRTRLHDVARLKDVVVPVGPAPFLADARSSFLGPEQEKVQIYFLDNQLLFGREGIYVDPHTGTDYPDNDVRFIFFCRGVLETLKRLGWQPDIIHCNDWPTGLIPAYLATLFKNDPFFSRTRTVFTIHNMAYQGIFPATAFPKTLLPVGAFSEQGILAGGNLNLLKSGLVYANALTTVSPRYAVEIQGDELGCGLQHIARSRSNDLHGIVNGVDYTSWDPEHDELIPHRYDQKTIEQKEENKKALLASVGLPYNPATPVIGMISRLADQKGFDLVGQMFEKIMACDVQLVVLGTGDRRYHDLFEHARRAYPQKVAVKLGFDTPLAHLIEAGSDMFLMPSRYEPCGLNQIYSLRYGTVPIVRATGGLDDTIEDYDAAGKKGTGFKFQRYDGGEMLAAIHRALATYADKAAWRTIMRNGMKKDYSWGASAKKYGHLYHSLMKQ